MKMRFVIKIGCDEIQLWCQSAVIKMRIVIQPNRYSQRECWTSQRKNATQRKQHPPENNQHETNTEGIHHEPPKQKNEETRPPKGRCKTTGEKKVCQWNSGKIPATWFSLHLPLKVVKISTRYHVKISANTENTRYYVKISGNIKNTWYSVLREDLRKYRKMKILGTTWRSRYSVLVGKTENT